MSGLSRTPGKRVYGESRTAGSNPALSASNIFKYPCDPGATTAARRRYNLEVLSALR